MEKTLKRNSGPSVSDNKEVIRQVETETKAAVTSVNEGDDSKVVRIRKRQIAIPDRTSLVSFVNNRPPLRPELIFGHTRCGTVNVISGTSKTGKTFATIDLAESIATGTPFLGLFQTKRSSVLYFNFEVTEEEFVNRALDVAEAKRITIDDSVEFDMVHCRGIFSDADAVTDYVLALHEQGKDYDVYIFDPVYVLNTGEDENASKGAGEICMNFSLICQITGGSVFYVGHHPKTLHGEQSNRISGSNIYGRHYDSSIDISPLDVSEEQAAYLEEKYGKKVKPVTIEYDARSFDEAPATKAVFTYPLFKIEDPEGVLKNAAAKGSPLANLKQNGNNTVLRKEQLKKAFKEVAKDGIADLKDLAKELGKTEKTVRNWVYENADYEIHSGMVYYMAYVKEVNEDFPEGFWVKKEPEDIELFNPTRGKTQAEIDEMWKEANAKLGNKWNEELGRYERE